MTDDRPAGQPPSPQPLPPPPPPPQRPRPGSGAILPFGVGERLDEIAQERFNRTDWIELAAAVILARATIVAAWSAYQATRWGGEQAKASRSALSPGLRRVGTGGWRALCWLAGIAAHALFSWWPSDPLHDSKPQAR